MKIHTKKKATRAAWKQLAKTGFLPRPDGSWGQRGSAKDDSQKRDFYPQSGK